MCVSGGVGREGTSRYMYVFRKYVRTCMYLCTLYYFPGCACCSAVHVHLQTKSSTIF